MHRKRRVAGNRLTRRVVLQWNCAKFIDGMVPQMFQFMNGNEWGQAAIKSVRHGSMEGSDEFNMHNFLHLIGFVVLSSRNIKGGTTGR